MDILEALAAAPAPSGRKCKIQRFLDDLDKDAPGYADLVAVIETSDPTDQAYRTQQQAAGVLGRLGLYTTYTAVGLHRSDPKRCRCAQ